jgi:hypothetical protein
MRKILIIATLLVIIPSVCFATYFLQGSCKATYCTEYPVFKVTWYGPDGIHVWERVCNLESKDSGAWWSFCVDNKLIVVPGNIVAEQLP